MYVSPKEVILSNGMRLSMKSPIPSDARNLMIYLKEVAKETTYMVRYIDEIGQSHREWAYYIKNASEQEGTLMLAIYAGNKILAMATLCRISAYRKTAHRAAISLSVLQEMWHLGLGRMLLQELLQYAKQMGYRQIELEVACDNINAISLYLSLGFGIYGLRKNAYYIEEKRYLDEYLMYKTL